MTALIDADSIIHIVAPQYKDIEPDQGSVYEIRKHIDSFIDSILVMTKATHYLGAIGTEDGLCFRHDVYKYNKYKGNRPPAPEWITTWKPHIRSWMASKWGFISSNGWEADDIVATVGKHYHKVGEPFIICAIDKDLNQIPGKKYNYKKAEDQFSEVTDEQANLTFWIQVISGDSSDGLAGVPGLGEVKAKKLLEAADDPIMYKAVAMQAYCKYFGEYYGPIIFNENYQCIKMGAFDSIDFDADYFLNSYLEEVRPVPTVPTLDSVFGD